jgi:hypothetical protein
LATVLKRDEGVKDKVRHGAAWGHNSDDAARFLHASLTLRELVPLSTDA